jgi:guanylate kinase
MKGQAIIFSAPSGAGKTTIVHQLIQHIQSLEFSISATTRPPREYEVDGKDYYFLDREVFEEKKQNGEFLEWEEVYEGIYYGTLKSEIERIWRNGSHVIFDVDVQGGLKIKKALNDQALAIFVKVDSPEILKERLIKRNTETKESLEQRVGKALLEMEESDKFDHIVINHNLDEAIAQSLKLVKDFIK